VAENDPLSHAPHASSSAELALPADRVTVGGRHLTIEDVIAVAEQGAGVTLCQDPLWVERIERGARFLRERLADGGIVYGVNTGYGDACVVGVPPELVEALPLQLTRYHGCGMGDYLDASQTRAVMLARLNSLAHGYSGVRHLLLQHLSELINQRVLPRIPAEGSVGASGDLTPLSYVAAALIGEREVEYQGQLRPATEVLQQIGLAPLTLAPKEGLALMNGTAVMTGLACLAWRRAEVLTQLASRLTALSTLALNGRAAHFDAMLFAAKPHVGQAESAKWIRADLAGRAEAPVERLQDRYSIRCAPHVIGVARDALGWMRRDIETELNSANDNPLIDPDGERVLHGGNFYGGHIAFAMDALKVAVANLADLMDRQFRQRPRSRIHQSWFQGGPYRCFGLDCRSTEIDHAGQRVFAVDRIAQPGQSQYGHDCRPRLPAGPDADGTSGCRPCAGDGAGRHLTPAPTAGECYPVGRCFGRICTGGRRAFGFRRPGPRAGNGFARHSRVDPQRHHAAVSSQHGRCGGRI